MILKRNPKRKHQVVLLLLQIPIESTLFFPLSLSLTLSLSLSPSPRRLIVL